jgi:cytochrome oxidase Cu insertion factor (SCO1/SenC/PrrC family)
MNHELTLGTERRKQIRARLIFLALCLLFALPYLASFYFYFDDQASAKLKTANAGLLVSPMRDWSGQNFERLDGTIVRASEFQGQWLILTLASSACERACNDNLYALKQVRKALGVDRQRVRRLLVLTDDRFLPELENRLQNFPAMEAVMVAEREFFELKNLLKIDSHRLENAFFVIDPMGNYMMFYPAGTHPKALLKDMQRLMKVSQL